MANQCGHGYTINGTKPWTPGGSTQGVLSKHLKKCPNARPFWHSGLLGKVICCLTCGKKSTDRHHRHEKEIAMAKQLTHEGTTSWWSGTYSTLCGITVPTSQTTNLWWSSTPTCPTCRAAVKAKKK